MRIAVCLSGQLRTADRAVESLKKFVGNLAPDVDYFVHTWDINSVTPMFYETLPHDYPYQPVSYEFIETYKKNLSPTLMDVIL
jgi:hypothetical protein